MEAFSKRFWFSVVAMMVVVGSQSLFFLIWLMVGAAWHLEWSQTVSVLLVSGAGLLTYCLCSAWVFWQRYYRLEEPLDRQLTVFTAKMAGAIMLGAGLEAVLVCSLPDKMAQALLLTVVVWLLVVILRLLLDICCLEWGR